MASSLGLSSDSGALDKASPIPSSPPTGQYLTTDIEVEPTSSTSPTLSTQSNHQSTGLAI